jgi:hypothetical protein
MLALPSGDKDCEAVVSCEIIQHTDMRPSLLAEIVIYQFVGVC